MSLNDFRVGLAGAPSHQLVERQTTPTGCNLAAGDLYSFPNSTSTIDGTVPLTFRWNTRCPGISSKVDLYLYAPAAGGQIKAWTGIDYATGQHTVQLLPRWWNSTTTALLQVNIVNAGGMSWASTGPPGPVWTVNYPESAMLATTTEGGVVRTLTNSAAATNGGDAIFQSVNDTKQGGISKGAIAAAVIVPIIVIAAVVAVAVRFWRQREAEKRRRWSQALSSTSNLDWEKGARPGDRPGPGNTGSILSRPSMTMSAYGAPGRSSMAASSVFALDNNMAGAGAGAAGTRPAPPMRSVSNDGASISRSSVMLPNGAVRQSRISFAESTRPDRRSRMSLGNDLRPHSAVFNLKGGSRSATELPLPGNSGLNSAASSVPSTPARVGGGARRAAYATGSAIADDDDADTSGEMDGAGGAVMSSTHLAGGAKSRSGRRSMLGLGAPRVVTVGEGEHEGNSLGPTKKDLRSASNASGSADELRELEQAMSYSAYSQSGQYSNPPTPRMDTDNDHTEDLATAALPTSASISAPAPAHTRPPLVASSSTSTVAYGPDQMLAVYAARARAGEAAHDGGADSGSGAHGATSPIPGPMPVAAMSASASASASGTGHGKASTGKKSGLKILTGFGKRHDNGHGLSPGGAAGSPTSAGPTSTGGHEIGQAR